MAIGGPSGNNPFDLSKLFKNAGVAQNNQTGKVSSTETETPVDTASKLSGVADRLRAQISGDVFKTAGPNDVAKTAGASPIASTTAIKFNETSGITPTSAPEPSSVAAIDGPGVVAATTNYNAQLKLDTTRLASLANGSNAQTVDGDFDVSAENTSLADNNTALAAARG
jgi:hypothetical protein